jgi:hypothetical protein
MEVSSQRHALATLPPRKKLGGWMRPGAGLDAIAKRNIPAPVRNRVPALYRPKEIPLTTQSRRPNHGAANITFDVDILELTKI